MTKVFGKLVHSDIAPSRRLSEFSAQQVAAELLDRVRQAEEDGVSLGDVTGSADFLALVAKRLEEHMDVHANRFSRGRLSDLFACMHCFPGSEELQIGGATYLEIGCGSVNPLGYLMIFLLLGAERGIGIDMDEPPDPSLTAWGMGKTASMMLADPAGIVGHYPASRETIARHAESIDIGKLLRGDPTGITPDRLQVRQESVYDLGVGDGEIDFVLSNSVFEHLHDVDAAIRELARVTQVGGIGAHNIDCRDHRSLRNPGLHPLEFLTIESDEPIVHECNRLRPHEFIERFERYGFEVLSSDPYDPIEIDAEFRSRCATPYRSMSDEELAFQGTTIHVRRAPSRQQTGGFWRLAKRP